MTWRKTHSWLVGYSLGKGRADTDVVREARSITHDPAVFDRGLNFGSRR